MAAFASVHTAEFRLMSTQTHMYLARLATGAAGRGGGTITVAYLNDTGECRSGTFAAIRSSHLGSDAGFEASWSQVSLSFTPAAVSS